MDKKDPREASWIPWMMCPSYMKGVLGHSRESYGGCAIRGYTPTQPCMKERCLHIKIYSLLRNLNSGGQE